LHKNQKFKNELELRAIFDYLFYKDAVVKYDGIYKAVDLNVLVEQIICHPTSSDDFVNRVSE
jgi:hypothetical protein